VTRNDLKKGVHHIADKLALHYGRARTPFHDFAKGLAAAGGTQSAFADLALLTKASLHELDQAGAEAVGLERVLPDVEREFGTGAKRDAAQVLKVFAWLYDWLAKLNVTLITSQRLAEDLAEGDTPDTVALQKYLGDLNRDADRLFHLISGFDGHKGPVDLVMTHAVNDLKASI